MNKVKLIINKYEDGKNDKIEENKLKGIVRHLNGIISILINQDNILYEKEFDLWRGMAAGTQAQGSWQNTKGDKAEILIKDLIKKHIKDLELIYKEVSENEFILKNGKIIKFSSEPDILILEKTKISTNAIEIKGGIDQAGVLERFGAALKSLQNDKKLNAKVKTCLIMQHVSLTETVKDRIKENKTIIDDFFNFEDIISSEDIRKKFFNLLNL